MKTVKIIFANLTLITFFLIGNVFAQDSTIVSANADAASGLDLSAVAELFKNSANLEEFEKELNDKDKGVNNLDLDENNEVDYLRVVEQVADDTHVVVVQAVFGEDQFQDVATISVEKSANDYNMQVNGDSAIYGENYYIVPRYTNLRTWRLINWIYRPAYRPYRSVFGWRTYPRWWRVRRPLALNVYRTRTVRFRGGRNFALSRTVRVRTVNKVRYTPRTTRLVKKKKVVVKKGNKTIVKKKGVKKTTNPGTGKTTVKKGSKKVVRKKTRKKTKKRVKVRKRKN